ncbi:hypothetical protein Acr_25g0005860 [Actinidia rufa]|uniref:Uncharacterized protein n=1 Tax=Actinidia rufa TaxID=165716 RepID=A0A7J0GZB7_9ERIC|nr:hypothetical protein Acr_25g0005860 [Actinidia rufa]
MDSINKVVELENNGRISQIRVMEEQLVVNTVLRTDCACPGCQVEVPSLNQNLDEASVQSPIKMVNGGNARPNLPLIEEVAESANYQLEKIVPFTGSSGYEHTTRGSRLSDYSPAKGKGAATPYLDALMSNLALPNLSVVTPKDSAPPPFIEILDEKPKRKQRSIEDILGLSKSTKSKSRRGKQKCVVYRSAMAAAALSVSSEGITNRNSPSAATLCPCLESLDCYPKVVWGDLGSSGIPRQSVSLVERLVLAAKGQMNWDETIDIIIARVAFWVSSSKDGFPSGVARASGFVYGVSLGVTSLVVGLKG